MKSYTLAAPPKCPGIYSITNSSTGHIYIGRSIDLHRRYAEWRGTITTNLGHKNIQLMDIAQRSAPEDWMFNVLKELPGVSDEELAQYEQRAISFVANKRPNAILNVFGLPSQAPAKATSRPDGGLSPKTTILGDDGNPITYRQAADALGTPFKQLQKRLAKKRANGQHTVTLALLKAQSEKARRERNGEPVQ